MDKPVVFGSIYKFSGQVAVFNFKNGPTYRCLYPTPPAPHEVLNCSDVGVLGVLPGIIGSFQANEVLKLIIGFGNVLSGKLLTFNALSMNQSIFSFEKNPAITITSLEANYQMLCGIHEAVKEISFQEYKKQSLSFNTLDVRTQDERDEFHILSIHIPLDELSKRYHELPGDKKLLIYCKSGSRSKIAIDILKNKDFKNELFNLKGGLLSQKAQI
jgi:adenylyltransferase/sulfurtransferase